MSGNDGDGRRETRHDDVYGRGDISVDEGRNGLFYQDTSHSSSCNCGQTVDCDCRYGYRSHISHSYSHKPGDYGILFNLPVASCHVYEIIHYNRRGDSRGDDGRYGISSQETSQSSFNNHRYRVDDYLKSGYRSQTRFSLLYNTGELGRLLKFSVHVHETSGHRS